MATAPPGGRLRISLANATTVDGRLSAIDANGLQIILTAGPKNFVRSEVQRVENAGVRSRHVRIGMVVGAIIGAVATPLVDRLSEHPSSVGEAAGLGALVIGLPVGAFVGAVWPTGPPLYEAPRLRR